MHKLTSFDDESPLRSAEDANVGEARRSHIPASCTVQSSTVRDRRFRLPAVELTSVLTCARFHASQYTTGHHVFEASFDSRPAGDFLT